MSYAIYFSNESKFHIKISAQPYKAKDMDS